MLRNDYCPQIELNMAEAKNDYVKNGLWMLLEKAARIISGVLVGVLVARYLGPGQFGLISYALSVIAIFTILSTLGLDGLVVRELITRPERQDEILGTSFWLRLSGSVLVVILATTYSYLRDPAERVWIVFIISLSIVFQSLAVVDFYFQSQVKGRYTAINQVITLFISAVVKLLLILVEAPVEGFAAMAVFEAALTFINQYIFFKRNGQRMKSWYFSSDETRRLFSHSWPIIISSLMQMIYQKADQILIARFLRDMSYVGQYAAAVRISEASFFIPVALSAAIFPGIINNRENRPLQLKRLTQLYSLMIWSGLLISIGGVLFGDWVIGLLYKDRFEMAPAVFKIHIWITIPIFFTTAWGAWLLALNKQYLLTIYQVFVLAFTLALEMLLIPRYGINGAAYSLVISYALSFMLSVVVYKPSESIRIFISAFNPAHLIDIFKYWKEMRNP